MRRIVVEQTTETKRRTADFRPARRVSLLGGTTTFGDCLVALRFLANPRQLVRGSAFAEDERAFAQQIGVCYPYTFNHGGVGRCAWLDGLQVGRDEEGLL